MDDQKRGNDAAHHVPKPRSDEKGGSSPEKQDEPNYDKRTGEGQALDD